MSIELLKPINDDIINLANSNKIGSIGEKIQIHTSSLGFPDLESTDVAIIGISETRNSYFVSIDFNLSNFRNEFYELNLGNFLREDTTALIIKANGEIFFFSPV